LKEKPSEAKIGIFGLSAFHHQINENGSSILHKHVKITDVIQRMNQIDFQNGGFAEAFALVFRHLFDAVSFDHFRFDSLLIDQRCLDLVKKWLTDAPAYLKAYVSPVAFRCIGILSLSSLLYIYKSKIIDSAIQSLFYDGISSILFALKNIAIQFHKLSRSGIPADPDFLLKLKSVFEEYQNYDHEEIRTLVKIFLIDYCDQ
jgi:hypothetical protein